MCRTGSARRGRRSTSAPSRLGERATRRREVGGDDRAVAGDLRARRSRPARSDRSRARAARRRAPGAAAATACTPTASGSVTAARVGVEPVRDGEQPVLLEHHALGEARRGSWGSARRAPGPIGSVDERAPSRRALRPATRPSVPGPCSRISAQNSWPSTIGGSASGSSACTSQGVEVRAADPGGDAAGRAPGPSPGAGSSTVSTCSAPSRATTARTSAARAAAGAASPRSPAYAWRDLSIAASVRLTNVWSVPTIQS